MKTLLFLLLLAASANANALSELVPTQNFLAVTDSVLWMDCKPMQNAHALQEAYTASEKANEEIKQAKNSLVIASLMYAVQNSLLATSGPVIYPLASNQCAVHSITALRKSLSALHVVAQETDEALDKLEFEIGHNFTGPGAEQLVMHREALEGQGPLGELMQSIGRSAVYGREANNPAATYRAVVLIIGNNGAVQEVENFKTQVEKSLEGLKTLEEELEAQLSEEVEETENRLKQLKQHGVEKLGLFELSAMKIQGEELVVDNVQSTSPAAMLRESEALLANAKNLEKTRKLYKSRGRTARRIEALTQAIQEARVAKTAAQHSWEKTTQIVGQLEQMARNEAEGALQIEMPIGRKIAEETITKFNPSDKYGERALQLSSLVYTLSRLRKTYDGEVEQGEKLQLKIELRELEELAKEAEKKGVTGAREIAAATKEMHSLINEVTDSAGLVSLELQKKQNEETLIDLVEERFGYLRDLYSQAVEAEKHSLLNTEEKT
ncbi:hypothetical protein HY571_01060, partial [Candidatus Micrarchaeota archaeon]|nr:hypothetical protein [Candidatus Micrarchaeota archaeon]